MPVSHQAGDQRPVAVALCVVHHPRLNNEVSAWDEVSCSITEDLQLYGQSTRIEYSIICEQYYCEPTRVDLCVAVITNSDFKIVTTGLLAKSTYHSLRGVDAHNADPTLMERQRESSGSDTEFEN